MEITIKSQEEHIQFLYYELESKETEIDDLKKSLDDATELCRLRSVSKANNFEDISLLKKLVKEQKVKMLCLRKHRSEILDSHEKMIDDYEGEFKAKEEDVKNIQMYSQLLKQQL
jgi:TRAP-type mannitol/chloroaromatic compound transport system substrate-binding protein